MMHITFVSSEMTPNTDKVPAPLPPTLLYVFVFTLWTSLTGFFAPVSSQLTLFQPQFYAFD